MPKLTVNYVTSNRFKQEENVTFRQMATLPDGSSIDDIFDFRIRELSIPETLEVRIEAMVTEEVKQAYAQLKVPCIVEHAGLIFDEYRSHSYPGGLTKPMWNTLAENFIEETRSSGRKAAAKAVVAYCDGMKVYTFEGETQGTISDAPRGDRDFYWDTVFVPTGDNPDQLTYAEIVESFGLEKKIQMSQSTKAMLAFLTWRRTNEPDLWQITY
ncbi:Ham1 family protein [Mycolicibacterium rutilum]|uniref:Ham1 family protein n=1 Tax=Mycolicibacterium rutilum TaxID=370526 RepID=A0A1H6K0F2_MYCRU|nr:non-canonical purine NTP pyrophosphatase [Mycolicibacterium rutilum]SEH64860.1 Ham1 family protein [Mycolicibacterium rutilum]